MGAWDRIRRAAAGDPGDDWRRAVQSLGDSGFPDSQMQLDTGHKLWVYHQGAGRDPGMSQQSALFGGSGEPGFHASVWHPAGDMGHNVEAYLGESPEHVGPLLRHVFRRPDVMSHMRDQMDRAQGRGPDQTGNRLMIDMTGGR